MTARGHGACEQHATFGGRLQVVDDVVTRNRQGQNGRFGGDGVDREAQRLGLSGVTRSIGRDGDQGVRTLTELVHLLFGELELPVRATDRIAVIDLENLRCAAVAVENPQFNFGTHLGRAGQGQCSGLFDVDDAIKTTQGRRSCDVRRHSVYSQSHHFAGGHIAHVIPRRHNQCVCARLA